MFLFFAGIVTGVVLVAAITAGVIVFANLSDAHPDGLVTTKRVA